MNSPQLLDGAGRPQQAPGAAERQQAQGQAGVPAAELGLLLCSCWVAIRLGPAAESGLLCTACLACRLRVHRGRWGLCSCSLWRRSGQRQLRDKGWGWSRLLQAGWNDGQLQLCCQHAAATAPMILRPHRSVWQVYPPVLPGALLSALHEVYECCNLHMLRLVTHQQ